MNARMDIGGKQPAISSTLTRPPDRPNGDVGPSITRPFRRFLFSSLATFIVSFAIIWVYVAAFPMAFLDRDYPLWIAKRSMLSECRLNTIAVFGDSRAVAGVVPRVMHLKVTNLAMSGTSPVETFFAVQRALRCATPPELVVIAHSPAKYEYDSDFWIFSARAGFLDFNQIRSVENDAVRLGDRQLDTAAGGLNLPPRVRDLLFAARFPPLFFSSLVNGFIGLRYWHNRAALDNVEQSDGHALFGKAAGSADVADEASARSYQVQRLNDAYFSRTLALLAQRHVRTILLTMPINQATYSRTPPALERSFASYLSKRTRQLANIALVDPRIPCWSNRLFGDAWHLNEQGAELFSRRLSTRLEAVVAGKPDQPPDDACPSTATVSTTTYSGR